MRTGKSKTKAADLLVAVWCPFCRRHHCHKWPHEPPFRRDVVVFQVAHCSETPDGWPSQLDEYYIGLDPEHAVRDGVTIRKYLEMNAAPGGLKKRMKR